MGRGRALSGRWNCRWFPLSAQRSLDVALNQVGAFSVEVDRAGLHAELMTLLSFAHYSAIASFQKILLPSRTLQQLCPRHFAEPWSFAFSLTSESGW